MPQREFDHVPGDQLIDVDPDTVAVSANHRLVADARMQGRGGAFGAVLVDESEADADQEDHPDDERLGAVAEEERDRRGGGQQRQDRIVELTAQHRPHADPMGAKRIRAVSGEPLDRLGGAQTIRAAAEPGQHLIAGRGRHRGSGQVLIMTCRRHAPAPTPAATAVQRRRHCAGSAARRRG